MIKQQHKLLKIEDVPCWMIKNRDIVSGYRQPNSTFPSLCCSLFYPHNDLLNIWSHVFGFIFFAHTLYKVWTLDFLDTPSSRPLDLEVFPIIVFLINVLLMMFFSIVYHTFRPKSPRVFRVLHFLDLSGISFFNFGGSLAVHYYYSYCDNFYKDLYISINLVASVAILVTIFAQAIADRVLLFGQNKLLFASLFFNFLIFLHWVYWGLLADESNDKLYLSNHLLLIPAMGSIYLLSFGLFYKGHIPEKYFPVKFDIICNSHTLWHVTSFFGLLVHYKFVCFVYLDRLNRPCLN